MIKLILYETKKFKNTYMNQLAFLGMISPVVLMAIAFVVAKQDFIEANSYSWYHFSTKVIETFVFLLGPLITCFLSVSSIYYEYQCKTMKNILTTTYSRTQVLLAKIIYLALQILFLYFCVALANIVCGYLLGFPITFQEIISYSSYFLLAGIATIIIIPLTMWITLYFKSFIPAMVLSVVGIIPNVSAYHWDKCYLSPWAAPEVLVLSKAGFMDVKLEYPTIAAVSYFCIFMIGILIYFQHSDQHC